MVSLQQKSQHLFWRAGFGVSASAVASLHTHSLADHYAAFQKAAILPLPQIDVTKALREAMGTTHAASGMAQVRQQMASPMKRRELLQTSRELLQELNLAWMDQMVAGEAQLREKMALFWHGHFACRNLNAVFQQLLLHDIRSNALGSFKDLLFAVSKSASMLSFLNNQQNRRLHPNENFAREVMELFTLGRGHYTETDIKEAARAFTGWGFLPTGAFLFRSLQHDTGSKTIFGKTGNFTGDDVLNMLLERQQTARHIVRKLYRYFVNEDPDESRIEWLAGRFYQSQYNIQSLMNDVFTSDWFYDQKHVGARIKSPVELLAGMRRLLPMTLNNRAVQLLMQKALGQVLFFPPNVAGWPGGKSWIDSSTLMLRLRIPQLIKDNEAMQVQVKTDDDVAMGMMNGGMGQGRRDAGYSMNVTVDWPAYVKQFEQVPREQLYTRLKQLVLQTPAPSVIQSVVEGQADKSSREQYIKTVTVALMSTPEYQLC